MMTSNRPMEDWGKLIGDLPSATAILDRFLHHAEVVAITGNSYRLRNRSEIIAETPEDSKPAKMHAGKMAQTRVAKSPPKEVASEEQAAKT